MYKKTKLTVEDLNRIALDRLHDVQTRYNKLPVHTDTIVDANREERRKLTNLKAAFLVLSRATADMMQLVPSDTVIGFDYVCPEDDGAKTEG